jgi:nucleoside-diphosphate-sugar epimerase
MPTVLITGAAGFIGQRLAERLLADPQYRLILTDLTAPQIPPRSRYAANATSIAADLTEPSAAHSLLQLLPPVTTEQADGTTNRTPPFSSSTLSSSAAVVLLHGIMSSGAEADLALGLRVNLQATLALLDQLRVSHPGIRTLYASSLAVYGRPLPPGAAVDESVHPTPESSYGSQKVACETILCDYTRRGLLDGLALRFPTVTVRSGAPTQAASSFLSGIVREPLAGHPCGIPLRDRSFRSWVCGPRTLVENLVRALEVDLAAGPTGGRVGLEPHRRIVNLPGFAVTVQEIMDALANVAGRDKLRFLHEEHDAKTEQILRSWPTDFDNSLALSLGFRRDESFEAVVRDYIETEGIEV